MIPTSSSSLVQVVVFACQQLSIPRQSTGRREQNTFSHCMYRRRHFVSTSHMMLHAHAWLRLNSVPKTFSHSISCFTPCLTPCTVHPAFCPFFLTFLYFLLLSPAQAQGRSRPEYTGQIPETLEVTVVRIQNLAPTVVDQAWLLPHPFLEVTLDVSFLFTCRGERSYTYSTDGQTLSRHGPPIVVMNVNPTKR